MIARTLHAISSDSKEVLAPGGVAGIQNPARIATETESHKTLYMPSRLTTSKGVRPYNLPPLDLYERSSRNGRVRSR